MFFSSEIISLYLSIKCAIRRRDGAFFLERAQRRSERADARNPLFSRLGSGFLGSGSLSFSGLSSQSFLGLENACRSARVALVFSLSDDALSNESAHVVSCHGFRCFHDLSRIDPDFGFADLKNFGGHSFEFSGVHACIIPF